MLGAAFLGAPVRLPQGRLDRLPILQARDLAVEGQEAARLDQRQKPALDARFAITRAIRATAK